LNGLEIDCAGAANNGIVFNSGGSLTVTNCSLQNFIFASIADFTTGNGILMQPTSGAVDFVITNTNVLNNARYGIQIAPAGSSSVNGAIDRVVATRNQFGIGAEPTTSGTTLFGISNSIANNNSITGIAGQNPNGGALTVSIDTVTTNGNVAGIAFDNAANVLLTRSVIQSNATGIANDTSPNTFYTYGNNVINLNGGGGDITNPLNTTLALRWHAETMSKALTITGNIFGLMNQTSLFFIYKDNRINGNSTDLNGTPWQQTDCSDGSILAGWSILMTLTTLADVRKLITFRKNGASFQRGSISRRRWKACVAGDDPVNISVALQIVLQAERAPYSVGWRFLFTAQLKLVCLRTRHNACLSPTMNLHRHLVKKATTMKRAILATTLLSLAFALPAHAQNGTLTRSFVSSAGNDGNPCTITQPCQSFAVAYTKISANGIIAALDPGKYGPITITGPVTINGNGWAAITAPAGSIGINIGAGAADHVRLSGLEIDGAGAGEFGIYVSIVGTLEVLNCKINDFSSNGANGLYVDSNTSSMSVSVTDTYVSNSFVGIGFAGLTGNSLYVTLDRVTVTGSASDFGAVSTDSYDALVALTIANSTFNNNKVGFKAGGTFHNSTSIVNSVFSNNSTSMFLNGSATLYLSHVISTNSVNSDFQVNGGNNSISSDGTNLLSTGNNPPTLSGGWPTYWRLIGVDRAAPSRWEPHGHGVGARECGKRRREGAGVAVDAGFWNERAGKASVLGVCRGGHQNCRALA
jgi:hypothetical protein